MKYPEEVLRAAEKDSRNTSEETLVSLEKESKEIDKLFDKAFTSEGKAIPEKLKEVEERLNAYFEKRDRLFPNIVKARKAVRR